ncbi:MAG: protein kinase [Gemmatimonadetes bacterium]|nr:protein kinase [Gemmatimonadota bacterium]
MSFAIAVRYRLDENLGARGRATLYRAHDLKLKRDVLLCIMWPEAAEAIGAELFEREMKAAQALHHPNIVPIHDFGSAYASLYYATPPVVGETLTARLRREGKLTIGAALPIIRDVAAALQYAHEQGHAHRDLKPDAIILTEDGAKLTDWGVSVAMWQAGTSRMRDMGMQLGITQYLSPEQATGEHEVTGRSDIFALGSVAYEMVTGVPAFRGDTPHAIASQVVTVTPPSPSQVDPSIPPNVDAAIRTAISKKPEDRFATAMAFVEALENPYFTTRTTIALKTPPDAADGWPDARSARDAHRVAGRGCRAASRAGQRGGDTAQLGEGRRRGRGASDAGRRTRGAATAATQHAPDADRVARRGAARGARLAGRPAVARALRGGDGAACRGERRRRRNDARDPDRSARGGPRHRERNGATRRAPPEDASRRRATRGAQAAHAGCGEAGLARGAHGGCRRTVGRGRLAAGRPERALRRASRGHARDGDARRATARADAASRRSDRRGWAGDDAALPDADGRTDRHDARHAGCGHAARERGGGDDPPAAVATPGGGRGHRARGGGRGSRAVAGAEAGASPRAARRAARERHARARHGRPESGRHPRALRDGRRHPAHGGAR